MRRVYTVYRTNPITITTYRHNEQGRVVEVKQVLPGDTKVAQHNYESTAWKHARKANKQHPEGKYTVYAESVMS